MYHSLAYDSINRAIPDLFKKLLQDGREVPSRNGQTVELAFTSITLYDSTQREILVPGRKHNLAAQIAETMWVLSGRNDIEWLSHYLPRAADYSDDGITWRGGYGKRIREWGSPYKRDDYDPVDQMQHVVDLLRATPDTRQAVISIYDPAIDTTPGKDIPCNDFLHFLNREGTLDLHIFVRSNDMMWGWSGINVFEWSALLEVVAGMTGLVPGALHFSVSSFHLYEQHWEKAQQIAQAAPPTLYLLPSPRFDPAGVDQISSFHDLCHVWFLVEELIRSEAVAGPLSAETDDLIDDFPEPMLQSWLRVLAWWRTGNKAYLEPLNGTTLYASAEMALQPVAAFRIASVPEPGLIKCSWCGGSGKNAGVPCPECKPDLIDEIVALHNEKDAAYGDSWCRRGEMLGIMANIARKVDRLGGSETKDETSVDTAMDLFVYLGKYLAWIDGGGRSMANEILRTVAETVNHGNAGREDLEDFLREHFDQLEDAVVRKHLINRDTLIASMLQNAWALVVLLAEA